MTTELIAVVVEQNKMIVELEAQISRLNQAHILSGIGELVEHLMDNKIGIVGDMTPKLALDHIKSLEARIAILEESPPEVQCPRCGQILVLGEEPCRS